MKLLLCMFLTLSQMAIAGDGRMDELFIKSIDDFFVLDLNSSPEAMSDMGITDQQHRWDDASSSALDKRLALLKDRKAWLKQEIDYEALNEQNKLNYELYLNGIERDILKLEIKDETYLIYAVDGFAEWSIYILTNLNKVRNISEAEAYISRLQLLDEKFDQYFERLERGARKNFLPPKFSYDRLLKLSSNMLTGRPFTDNGKDSPLLTDFKNKLIASDIDEASRLKLIARCEAVLLKDVKRAFGEYGELLKRHQGLAIEDDGLSARPNGAYVYKQLVRWNTTTELTPDQIHEIGLKEVKRIHNEMIKLQKEMGFPGSLADLFHFLRTDRSFYLPNTDEGRNIYLRKNEELINHIQLLLPEYFLKIPKARVEVRRVEPFKEAVSPTAFYVWPSADGTRPGVYYLNLSDMNRHNMTKINVYAIHEAVPGHHMQLALEGEMKNLPKFRTQVKMVAAFQEGWGMYSEFLGKEMGLYRDHWTDIGRLNMELWRAIRLVLDTGIHAKGWSREKAREFAFQNSPEKEIEIMAEVDRFTVYPGQATAYKIGMIKIVELRRKAEAILGDKFDLRKFHDTVLKNGSVPLNILETQFNKWIESEQKGE